MCVCVCVIILQLILSFYVVIPQRILFFITVLNARQTILFVKRKTCMKTINESINADHYTL